ncbi:MAG: dihydrodipicolinate synthase family protein [Gemmatimonadaceae bacterium]
MLIEALRTHLLTGHVIPAHPLALKENLDIDEKHQRALTRYYIASGAGGMAVGVHTTGFPIHDPKIGLYEPVLALAQETATDALRQNAPPAVAQSVIANQVGRTVTDAAAPASVSVTIACDRLREFVRVAGLVGRTEQALREAAIARRLGYDCGLLSLGAWREATSSEIQAHCRHVAEAIPLFGFYLQPAVGGRVLDYDFWRGFCEITNVVAIKVAPFSRYATLSVVRAVADSGRRDVALYTGNDDAIVSDLVTDASNVGGTAPAPAFVGGLLGQWAVWTHKAVELLDGIRGWRTAGHSDIPRDWLRLGAHLTEANAAIFDATNNFAGCLPGILEILRQQGLVRNTLTFDDHEQLSPGQAELIALARARFPHLTDDAFVAEHLDKWLR